MPVNRDRQKVWRERDVIDIYGDTLNRAIRTLWGLRDEFGGDARIEKRIDPYSISGREYLALMVEDDETDKEMEYRIQKEEKIEAYTAESDRMTYERLKAKFGD